MTGKKELYDINTFLTNEWLDKLDDSTILCGEYAYKNEVVRFMEIIDNDIISTDQQCKYQNEIFKHHTKHPSTIINFQQKIWQQHKERSQRNH